MFDYVTARRELTQRIKSEEIKADFYHSLAQLISDNHGKLAGKWMVKALNLLLDINPDWHPNTFASVRCYKSERKILGSVILHDNSPLISFSFSFPPPAVPLSQEDSKLVKAWANNFEQSIIRDRETLVSLHTVIAGVNDLLVRHSKIKDEGQEYKKRLACLSCIPLQLRHM